MFRVFQAVRFKNSFLGSLGQLLRQKGLVSCEPVRDFDQESRCGLQNEIEEVENDPAGSRPWLRDIIVHRYCI